VGKTVISDPSFDRSPASSSHGSDRHAATLARDTSGTEKSCQVSAFERIAWYSLLAVCVAVPTAVGYLPLSGLPPFTFDIFVYPKVFVLGWLVGISLLSWAGGVLTGHIEVRTVPLRLWLGAFLGLTIVSTFYAMDPTTAVFGGRPNAVGLLALLLCGALYLLVAQLVTTKRRMRALAWAMVAGGVIVAAVGLLQVLGADAHGPGADVGFMLARGASLLGNPDFTGTYLVMPAVLSAALALHGAGPRGRVAAASAFVLTTAALAATLSRGAWLGLALGLVALGAALMRSGSKSVRLRYVAAAAAAALAVPLVVVFRDPTRAYRQIADLAAGGLAGGGRLILWHEALAVIATRPLFGTGASSYWLGWYAARSAASVRLLGFLVTVDDPHNAALLLAATLGIPAALAGLGLVGVSLGAAGTTAFARKVAGDRLMYAGWWGALFGLCVALFFEPVTIPVVAAVLVCAGVLAAARSKSESWPPGARYVACTAVGLLAVTSIVISTLSLGSDTKLASASASADKVAVARGAAALAPWNSDARDQAVYGYANVVLEQIMAGDPRAAGAAQLAEQQLRDLVSTHPYEYKNYASMVLGDDAFRRAAAAADRALEIYPLSPEAAYLKSTAQISLGDPAGAVRTLDPVWELDHGYAYPGVVYAEALAAAGDQARAETVMRTLEKRFPDNQDVRNMAKWVRSRAPR
jgi:O-antigen ligase